MRKLSFPSAKVVNNSYFECLMRNFLALLAENASNLMRKNNKSLVLRRRRLDLIDFFNK